ncbi:MAG: adenylate/guanylate cyclase domain-containing protein, partial [Nannocystaceae bacterium]
TIGDCYMASCGVPSPRPDHAAAIADFALDVRALCEGRSFRGHRLALRIGVHSGPVIAGVIGQHRQLYDLWGETVNTASRMESHGEPGEVQVSAATASLLADTHAIRERGSIEVKGIGAMTTAFIVGRREERPAGDAPPAAGRR